MATIIPFAEAAARLRARKARAMLNTRLFNFHDVVMIGLIAIIAHLLVKPLLARIDLSPAEGSSASTNT